MFALYSWKVHVLERHVQLYLYCLFTLLSEFCRSPSSNHLKEFENLIYRYIGHLALGKSMTVIKYLGYCHICDESCVFN